MCTISRAPAAESSRLFRHAQELSCSVAVVRADCLRLVLSLEPAAQTWWKLRALIHSGMTLPQKATTELLVVWLSFCATNSAI